MTVNNFTASVSGDFATSSNWSLGHVPNDTEDAEIDPANGDFAVESTAELVNSIGTFFNDGLVIDDGASLTAFSGTGPDANDGSISIVDADLFLGSGTFDNVGTVALDGVDSSDVGTFDVEGSITLNGGGAIAASIVAGGRASDNVIGGFNFSTTPTLVNVNNTISGDVTIGGLNFTNQADGLIQTNNSSSSSGGSIAIQGSAGGGSFTNDGGMNVNSGGQIIFGIDNRSTTIDNEGSIFLQADDQFTRLVLSTGSVTISAGGLGRIQMFGQTPSDDQIEDLGQPTSLNLINQILDGAGEIGIGDNTLTLDLESGEIEADIENQVLLINTGGNTITNGGTLQAIQGGDLVIDSPIANQGTINVAGDGSVVELFGAVSGSGSIDVGAGGVLDIHASISGNFSFTGVNGVIKVESGGSLQGAIAGAVGTDQIDLRAVAFASSDHAVWQQNGGTGTLSLVDGGGATLAAFTLSGQYSSADFGAGSDGSGGTLLDVLNPPPPAGATADMIMTDGSGNYEIYDIGGNAVQAAYTLDQLAASLTFAALGTFKTGDTSDMLVRNSSTGAFDAYYVSGNSVTGTAAVGTVGTDWNFAGTGDFDGASSLSELLLRNSNSGAFELYQVAGGGVLSGSSVAAVGNNFTVKGFGHFSESSTTQMMMQGNSGGSLGQLELYTYQPGSASFAGIDVGAVGSNLTFVGCADLLGNGSTQMVMQQNNGNFWIYTYSASTNSLSGQLVGAIGSNFRVVGFGPLAASGQDEMLMQDATGDFEVYQYNAGLNAFVGNAMGAVGAPWRVDGIAATDPPASSGGVSVGSASTAQLVQAMASVVGGPSASTLLSPVAGAQMSSPTLLAAPHA